MIVGFTITKEDIKTVLESYNTVLSQRDFENASSLIDDQEVQNAAFSIEYDEKENCDILDRQTEAAYDEIARQLFKLHYLSRENILQYGNPAILEC